MPSNVAVVIPSRGKSDLLDKCLAGLFKSSALELEIVVIEQGGEDCKRLIEEKYASKEVIWLRGEDSWSYSQLNNAGAALTKAAFLLLLNNDTVPRRGFLSEMLQVMVEHPEVGVVGAKLLYPDRRIQHVGVAFRHDGVPYHIGWGRPDDGTFMPASRDDYYDSVTFACALVRREVWEAVGGLDERYHFNYEDADFCLRAAELGWRTRVAHKAVIVHHEGQSGEQRSTHKHSVARNFKRFWDKWVDSGRLEKVAKIQVDKRTGTARPEKLNVAFVPSGRAAGVPWWRMELPSKKLAKLGLVNVAMVYGDMPESRIMRVMELADVAVFQGFSSEWTWRIASLGTDRRFKMVYDYDDHPIHISPFSQAYRHFGCQEIRLQADDGTETWLWRDGESGFDLKANLENRQRQLEIFHLVDLVTTSTPPLHKYFSTLNPKVALLPNCIDFDVYRHQYALWERRPGPVRIGWHGGDNHWHDISSVAPPLVDYVNGHDVQLVLFGAYYKGPFRGIDESKIVEEEWVHVEGFPYKLASLGIDVAVIPLADPSQPFMQFNHYKSDIKFLEYAALRIPSLVVEGRAAYACCTDGENCLTYSTDEEFTEKLHALCMDADLRRHMGIRALEWVREYRDLEKCAHKWAEAFDSIASVDISDLDDDGPRMEEVSRRIAGSVAAEGS